MQTFISFVKAGYSDGYDDNHLQSIHCSKEGEPGKVIKFLLKDGETKSVKSLCQLLTRNRFPKGITFGIKGYCIIR